MSCEMLPQCDHPSVRDGLDCGALLRAVRGSRAGHWEWNLSTDEVWYAPGFLELLGVTQDDLPGVLESWKTLIHPEDFDDVWQEIEHCLLTGELLDIEYRMRTKQGKYIWLRARGTTTFDACGKPVTMAGSIRNVDQLKEAKARLREEQEQVRQQHRIDALGRLASGVAHEFNNLLQTIGGYTMFALKTLPQDSSAYQDLEKVCYTTEQAAQLTRKLLEFSRIGESETSSVSIGQIFEGLEILLKPLLPREVDFCTHYEANAHKVMVDRQLIEQALLNLCINARDAMPEGGTLTLTTSKLCHPPTENGDPQHSDGTEPPERLDLPAGEYVELAVSDTGTGISSEVRGQLFEPFFTTKEFGKGTGLGLSVALGVVQQAGGTIHCSNNSESGATFRVILPVYEKPLCDLPGLAAPAGDVT